MSPVGWRSWSLERAVWLAAVALGGSIVWWAPHPPMIDLPQHAGQVRLLHDMVLDQSPWSPRLRVNLLTPYLIGYGLALPLSFFMSVTAAVKALLTIAYVCFVAMCVRLGRHWKCDPRLDWLYVPGFFGFAFNWGFFTFLVASPVGLLFLWLAERHALRKTGKSALAVLVCGLALLASHGLMFLFCASLGAVIVARLTPLRQWLRRGVPFLVLLTCFGVYVLASRRMEAGMDWAPDQAFLWDLRWSRLVNMVIYAVGQSAKPHALLCVPLGLLLLPLLLGSRLSASRRIPILVFCGVAGVLLLAPTFAFRTAYLNERFALFFFPAYAWLFAAPLHPVRSNARVTLATTALALCVGTALVWHVVQFRRFAQETAAIDAEMQALLPNQRVFSLVFDHESTASGAFGVYTHYPAWYQAEHGGFTEFNFAWYPPQVVRFRPDHRSTVKPAFEWTPGSFDWVRHDGNGATYFFVRSRAPTPVALFAGAPCPPAVQWRGGEWTIYERVTTCR